METWNSLLPQKVTGSLEVAVTNFMTQRSRWPLWSDWPSLWPQEVQGHKRSPWPTLWPQRSRWPLWSVWPSLWPQKVTGSLEVRVTYFMTPKVNLTFDFDPDLVYDQKGHGVIRDCDDLLYDPKGQLDLWLLPLPSLWPQKVTGS